jgi:hypothetical protein
MDNLLEWIITKQEGDKVKAETVAFKDIFPQADKIISVMMLWNTNSYYVNAKDKYFIINGGRRIQPTGLLQFTDSKVVAIKRHRVDMPLNGEDSSRESTSFLLGINGILNEEKRELYLHISPDGSLWTWKANR